MIDKIHFLAQKPSLFINKNDRYFTTVSLIMGVFGVLTILILSFLFINDFFSGKYINAYLSQSTKYFPVANMTQSMIMFQLHDVYGNTYNESVSQFVAQKWSFTPKVSSKANITNLKVEKCKREDFNVFSNIYTDLPVESYYCIQTNSANLTIYGKAQDTSKDNSYLMIYIVKCIDSSPYNTENISCQKESDINSLIGKRPHFISVGYVDYEVDNDNITTPVSTYVKTFTLPVGLNLIYRHLIYLKNVIYGSDNGIIFSNIERSNFFQFNRINSEAYMNPFTVSGSFGAFTFTMSEITEIYTRKFEKLQNLFANIVGVTDAIIFISTIIVKVLSNNIHLNHFNNTICDINDKIQGSSVIKEKRINLNFPNPSDHFEILTLSKKNNSSNEKKQVVKNKIKLSIFDILFSLRCYRNTLNARILKIVDETIKDKLSIEKILECVLYFEEKEEKCENALFRSKMEKSKNLGT
jgi:hypothetical protein